MPLASIIGHTALLTLLRQAVARGRVPQSLLFAGPAGVGKRAVAVALAQAVNCPARRATNGDDACGVCATCQRIARGQHTDVTVIDTGDEASIKIKVLRERLFDVVGYRPFEGERRVFIIDPADELTVESQDALLKTLEEPPPSAILILISEYPDTLVATIQSRCRRLRFGPLSEADVARVLVRQEKLDPARARALAAASGGSVSRALEEDAGDLAEDREAAFGVLTAARSRDVAAKLRAATILAKHDSERRDREALGMRLSILASLLRDLGVLASASRAALANGDLEPELRSLVQAFTLARVSDAHAAVDRAQSALDRNASPKLVADWIAASI
jgi:DNA polymerase-3 subunit delta'